MKTSTFTVNASRLIFTTAVFWALQTTIAQAQEMTHPDRTQTLTSQYDFTTTVARLNDALNSHGITLFADIDQSAAATRVGMTLRPTRLFLFGNPKGGTPAMQANPHAAVELPLRAVVWEDEHGIAHIDYQNASGVLASDYGLAQNMVAPLAVVRTLLELVAGTR